MSFPSDLREPVVDARGRAFRPLRRPVRVVSLVPSLTELLYDLGVGDGEVVGRTRFCVHPRTRVRNVPSVGGTKDFRPADVLALRPDLVIANIDENPKELVEQLDATRAEPFVFVTHPSSVDETFDLIATLGAVLDAAPEAEALLAQLRRLRTAVGTRRRGNALYLIWRDPWMTVAPGTFIDDMLRTVGVENAVTAALPGVPVRVQSGAGRYPVLTIDDMVRARPDAVLLSSEPYPFRDGHVSELRAAFLQRDPAWGEAVDIRLVDGEHFSWYGSRMLHAFRAFADEAES